MSTSTSSASQAKEGYQRIPVASLRVGQQLPFDIHEENEEFLLRRGSVVTPKVVRSMQERKLAYVFVKSEALRQNSGQPAEPRAAAGPTNFHSEASRAADATAFDDEIAQGTALIESFRPREAVAYDKHLVKDLIDRRDRDAGELSSQLTELVEGSNEVPGRSIEKMATSYIWSMAQDLDASLSVAQVPPKEDYWSHHALEMAILGMGLGAELGLTEVDVRLAGISALIHDLGMKKVPAKLQDAPRRLDRLEFFEIQKHPIFTLDLTEKVIGIPNRCRLIIYQVHERNDGSGYPRNRDGSRTYMLAKIIGIVDAYLALLAERPYRKALLPYHAMTQILHETRRGKWDNRVTRGLLGLIGLFPVGSFVMLSDDSLARVIRSGGENYAKPQIIITHNSDGIPQDSETVIDLAEEPEEGGLRIVQAVPPLSDMTAEPT